MRLGPPPPARFRALARRTTGLGAGVVTLALAGALAVGESVPAPCVGCATEYDGGVPLRVPGVGSNRSHPTPAKYSSGQACASEGTTSRTPSTSVPGRNPVAVRAGMPRLRAMSTIAVVNCTQ